jgi:hypothetical protein
VQVRDSIARFADIVQARFVEHEGRYISGMSTDDANASPAASARLTKEAAVVEQVQAMCSLARSGIETLGWWNAMQQRFDLLTTTVIQYACESGPAAN